MPPRPPVQVVGPRLDPEDYRLRDFLTRGAQPHDFYEAGTPAADEVLDRAGARGATLPVVVDGDTVYAGATVQRREEAWDVFARPKRTHYDLFIVGAGNSAGQAVMNLASAGARVTQVVRGGSLSKSMSAYLVERVEASEAIDVRLSSQVRELHEEAGRLDAVTIASADSAPERIAVTALFLCIGGVPRTAWAPSSGVRTDRNGFILTGPDLLEGGKRPDEWPLDRDPLALETNIPGVFAAGDVRHGSVKRVAGAVGQGSMAVAFAHHRLEELHGRS